MSKEKQELQDFLDSVKSSNILVIVEGKKDRAALKKLGITNIMELSKKPLFRVVEEISGSNKECIILTDLDRKGREIYGKLNSDLQKNGVKVDNRLREFLFKSTRLRQIEGLSGYLERQQAKHF